MLRWAIFRQEVKGIGKASVRESGFGSVSHGCCRTGHNGDGMEFYTDLCD